MLFLYFGCRATLCRVLFKSVLAVLRSLITCSCCLKQQRIADLI
jgi:hypothetical protein